MKTKFSDAVYLSESEMEALAQLAGEVPLAEYIAAVLCDHLVLALGQREPHQFVKRYLAGEMDAALVIRALESALPEAEQKLAQRS